MTSENSTAAAAATTTTDTRRQRITMDLPRLDTAGAGMVSAAAQIRTRLEAAEEAVTALLETWDGSDAAAGDAMGRAIAALAYLKTTVADCVTDADAHMALLSEEWTGWAADAFRPHHPAWMQRAARMQAAVDTAHATVARIGHDQLTRRLP